MKQFLYISFFLSSIGFYSQNSLTPAVIGAQGDFVSSANGNSLQYTVGEVMILTTNGNSGNMLTQGFNQPMSMLNANLLTVHFNTTESSCFGIYDGSIVIDSISGCDGNYSLSLNGITSTDLTFDSLVNGIYLIDVNSGDGCSWSDSIEIGILGEDCDIHFYNAFSPNGDLTNDTWIIDQVESYQDNSVQIYDRWGVSVYNATNYNNQDVVWDGTNTSSSNVPDGTYFFIFNSGDFIQKGYVEITR